MYARRLTIQSLGQLKDTRAVEPLIQALKNDEEANVRISAAYALGQLKDTRAVEPLIQALRDEDTGVRLTVAGVLGQLNNSSAIEPLIEALKHEEWSPESWKIEAALRKLGWQG